jgi:large subunit ribosomal protein L41
MGFAQGWKTPYRKKYGLYSFKLTKNRVYKNPHAMSLRKKEDLKKIGYEGELRIREQERLSERPFGNVSRKGRFMLDIEKVPVYNIPDLTGFALKPYVSHLTTKVDPKTQEDRKIVFT